MRKGVDRLFCEDSVNFLNEILVLTNAKIVITSNWRLYLNTEELNTKFKERGVIGEVISQTNTIFAKADAPFVLGNRGLEIKNWLEENHCTEFIVIDDQITDIKPHIANNRIIKVNPMIGLSSENVDKAVDELL